ncbi:unnamed protein product [Discosporangium mesarthrocarpum]
MCCRTVTIAIALMSGLPAVKPYSHTSSYISPMVSMSFRRTLGNRQCPLTMKSAAKSTLVSRRQLIVKIAAGLITSGKVLTAPAAIPTVEEYAVGSGYKIKERGSEPGNSPPKNGSSTVFDPNDLMGTVGAASTELARLEGLMNQQKWGDALSSLRRPPITVLKSPSLGLGSAKAMEKALGVPPSKAAHILEAREEAAFNLGQLEDVVFSYTRTLEFFNSEDLKQVQRLASSARLDNLDEALGLLHTTLGLVNDLRSLMKND